MGANASYVDCSVREHEDSNHVTQQQLALEFGPLLQVPTPLFGLFLAEYDRIFGDGAASA